MNTVYILLMLWGGDGSNLPGKTTTVVQQEFNSFETCEAARKHLEKADRRMGVRVLSQGCFKK